MGDPVRFLLTFLAAVVLTPLAARLGRTIDVVDRPPAGEADGLKIHTRPIPLTGGAAVASVTLGAGALAGVWRPWGVLAAALVALAGGLVDDAHPLSPSVRVVVLSVAAALLAAGGFPGIGVAAAIGAALLALAASNAVNLVDGQDGLAGGLGAISALALALLLHGADDPAGAGLALALAGGLAGFLVWNRPPASVFLGGGGAYMVGVILAALATRLVALEGARGLLAAGLALGVFAFELAFTVLRRVVGGRRLAGGDREHAYDLLAARAAGGRNGSTIAFWCFGILAGLLALVAAALPVWAGALVLAIAATVATAWVAHLWAGRPMGSVALEGGPTWSGEEAEWTSS